ncbi:MAG TPA: sugar phosphate nucleotidyltransferase, partial [Myxococcales bacterium]|nr:sugar phosphate nucleotidyltransferase [Myxococcales bacterium]
HVEGVREALPDLPAPHLLVEPAARNTAPAIGLAAVHVLREDREAVMLVLPSDHHIAQPERFRDALEKAALVARQGDLVTLGIQPTRAETGYGYVRRGAEREPGVFAVESFVEKPDAATAKRYLADARYAWNAGIFVLRADAFLDALRRHLPAAHEGLQQIAANPGRAPEIFPRLPAISIDYGVMEPESTSTRRIAMVAGDELGWSDVGSFATLSEVRALDAQGNSLSGDALTIDCSDCVVLADAGRLVAVVGMKGACIVDAGDALLVVPRDRAQDVRAVVDALKAKGRSDKL